MFVDYTPEGQETQRFEFKPGRVRLDECARIEFAYGNEGLNIVFGSSSAF